MVLNLKHPRDLLGGGIVSLFGLVGIGEGYRLDTGSLTAMGPGFMPLTLGVILFLLGVLIMVKPEAGELAPEIATARPEWRGWLCILGGMAAFIVLGPTAGLVPAAFCCVFISAMGDRTSRLKEALLLASVVTVFGVVLFYYVLKISIPLFWWDQ